MPRNTPRLTTRYELEVSFGPLGLDLERLSFLLGELGDHYEIGRPCWVSRRFLTRPTKRTEILFKDKVRRILRQCRK